MLAQFGTYSDICPQFSLYIRSNSQDMAEIKMRPAIYANHKRKDGSYPVKIVVYFKGKERKLPTNIACNAEHLTRELHIKKHCEPMYLALDQIRQWQDACKDLTTFDLEYRDVDFVVNHIKAKLAKEHFRLDFFQFGEQHVAKMKSSTAAQYIQAMNALARFLGKREIDINQITRGMVAEFATFINKESRLYWNKKTQAYCETDKTKIAGGQAARHVMKLSSIYKVAQKTYNDEDADKILIPRSPFSNHELDMPSAQGQKPLPKETIQRLISAKVDNPNVRTSIDIAVVSFGLMGPNMADLFEAKRVTGDTWVYYRKKTRDQRADKAEVRVKIPECLAPYIKRLQGRSRIAWFGRLHDMNENGKHITKYINAGLAKWCEREGIETFTFYAVRKSWATIARKEGVEKALVDEGLAHVGDYKMTDIYAERPWDKINEANSKVLALFNWD